MHTQDLKKVQERQEMARVIGEIANNAISIATYEEREKMNKLGLEKFKLEEQKKALGDNDANRAQVAALDKQIGTITQEINKTQQKIDNNVGIGSPNGMAIRAVTAALQAAAQNDTNGAIVALASPYLNKQIHDMTKENTAKDKAANLAAHALLSAVEFQVTGKDPLTGAVAGVTGEATATILTKALYGKTPEQLTVSEKENISTLSQLAGGLAASLTAKANGTTDQQGGTFISATAGAETAKRAVENNLLAREEDEELFNLSEKFNKNKALKVKDKERASKLLTKDAYINFLIQLNQKEPGRLTEAQKTYLNVELSKISRSLDIPIQDLYNWDFSNIIKRNDTALTKYISDDIRFWNSYEGRQAESLAIGILATGGATGIIGTARTVPAVAKYTQELAKFSASNPVTAEMLVTGGYKAGEISYKAYDGQYKTEVAFQNDAYGEIKDLIKVPVLSKLKPAQQAINSVAFDFVYEVNKTGATDKQVKAETIGSLVGSGYGLTSEAVSTKYLNLHALPKVFLNVVGGAVTSDKAKEVYQNMNKEEK
ncbi:VENN motif pre-toxin domain-containing protein [Rodentibacter trehalosifermentans]|uniref:VENN motif pre-toxin domain-containing protein n=1 Tax=Rodentibacter trehalosifermentans TaxID=1908263 RepID=UPI00277B4FFB|nr:VENN motif pre-toxin domain-containing protein [Rodentibacter trehalosifermentans]